MSATTFLNTQSKTWLTVDYDFINDVTRFAIRTEWLGWVDYTVKGQENDLYAMAIHVLQKAGEEERVAWKVSQALTA